MVDGQPGETEVAGGNEFVVAEVAGLEDVEGQVVWVTGAGTGIGSAVALEFAR